MQINFENKKFLSFKKNIIGMSKKEIKDSLIEIDVPEKEIKMRINQIFSWIYNKGVKNFDEMSNI